MIFLFLCAAFCSLVPVTYIGSYLCLHHAPILPLPAPHTGSHHIATLPCSHCSACAPTLDPFTPGRWLVYAVISTGHRTLCYTLRSPLVCRSPGDYSLPDGSRFAEPAIPTRSTLLYPQDTFTSSEGGSVGLRTHGLVTCWWTVSVTRAAHRACTYPTGAGLNHLPDNDQVVHLDVLRLPVLPLPLTPLRLPLHAFDLPPAPHFYSLCPSTYALQQDIVVLHTRFAFATRSLSVTVCRFVGSLRYIPHRAHRPAGCPTPFCPTTPRRFGIGCNTARFVAAVLTTASCSVANHHATAYTSTHLLQHVDAAYRLRFRTLPACLLWFRVPSASAHALRELRS